MKKIATYLLATVLLTACSSKDKDVTEPTQIVKTNRSLSLSDNLKFVGSSYDSITGVLDKAGHNYGTGTSDGLKYIAIPVADATQSKATLKLLLLANKQNKIKMVGMSDTIALSALEEKDLAINYGQQTVALRGDITVGGFFIGNTAYKSYTAFGTMSSAYNASTTYYKLYDFNAYWNATDISVVDTYAAGETFSWIAIKGRIQDYSATSNIQQDFLKVSKLLKK